MMMMAQVGDDQRRRGHDAFHLYNNSSGQNTTTTTKKLKTGTTSTTTPHHPNSTTKSISSKEKNDKFGERVAALQKLVSPFGKTDTASVLSETTGYIRFLHEQLQVLSAPYIGNPTMQQNNMDSVTVTEDKYSLRKRGLCLMPIATTERVAHSNGADLWAPTK